MFVGFMGFFLFIFLSSVISKEKYYKPECILFIAILIIMYKYYKELNIIPLTFFCSGLAMSLHLLGWFGLFSQKFLGLNFDVYTHFFASFAVTLILYFALKDIIKFDKKWSSGLFVMLILFTNIGLSVMGEFVEFTGEITTTNGRDFLGLESESSPYLKLGDDYWDTITDLMHNFIGSIAGLAAILFLPKRYYPKV